MTQYTVMVSTYVSVGNGRYRRQAKVVRHIGAKDIIGAKTIALSFSKCDELNCIWPVYPRATQVRKISCK